MHYIPKNHVYVTFRYNEKDAVMIILNNHPAESRILELDKFKERLEGYTAATKIITRGRINLGHQLEIKPKSALILDLEK